MTLRTMRNVITVGEKRSGADTLSVAFPLSPADRNQEMNDTTRPLFRFMERPLGELSMKDLKEKEIKVGIGSFPG